MRTKMLILSIFFLLVSCIGYGEDEEKIKVNTLFGLDAVSSEDIYSQPIMKNIPPDDVKNGTCLILDDLSRFSASSKKNLSLKECTLTFWIYISGDNKIIPQKINNDGDYDRINRLFFGLGSTPKDEKEPSKIFPNRLGARIGVDPAAPNKYSIAPFFYTRFNYTLLNEEDNKLDGWYQIIICVKDIYVLSYINNTPMSFGKIAQQQKRLCRILPFNANVFTVTNGLVDEKNTGIGKVAISQISVIDKCLLYKDVSTYCQEHTLPADANAVWTIAFSSKGADAKSTEFKTSKNIKYLPIEITFEKKDKNGL